MELKSDFEDMLRELASLPGGECVASLAETLRNSEPEVSVRLNRDKYGRGNDSRLSVGEPVEWCPEGMRIFGERPRFTMDPAMHQGRYYVQEASSMIYQPIVGQMVECLGGGDVPLVYADFCAAPGGKTTTAASVLPAGSLIVANEFDPRRCNVLAENLMKWGLTNVIVSRGDTQRLARAGEFADIVAVDAPCSGEGMMRKEEVAASQWSTALVADCASLQRSILANAWRVLRPGGYLIYSTCTFNRDEDEANVAFLIEELGAKPVDTQLAGRWGICGAIGSPYPALRFIPGKVRGEGLFAAVVRKPGEFRPREFAGTPRRKPSPFDNCILDPASREIIEEKGVIRAIDLRLKPLYEHLLRYLDVVSYGVEIGRMEGGGKSARFLPSQSLAMSLILNRESFPEAEVDYRTAIAFLRGEGIRLDTPCRGPLLLTFESYPLGFVKGVGNRANNYYPRELCIKSGFVPDSPPSLGW